MEDLISPEQAVTNCEDAEAFCTAIEGEASNRSSEAEAIRIKIAQVRALLAAGT